MSQHKSSWPLLGVTLLLVLTTVACSDKNIANSDGRGNTGDLPSTGNYLFGECNRLNVGSPQIKGTIGTYYDPITRQYRDNMINLSLKIIPLDIFNSDTTLIQFFRWSDNGTRITNQVPVRFFFIDKLTGAAAPQNNTVDRISKATLTEAKNTWGGLWSNITLPQFFDRATIVLTGVDYQYHGISMAYYNTAVSTTAVGIGNALLPPFYSNPNVFKTYFPQPGLYTLHPNYAQINANATEGDYWRMIEDICVELAGLNTRIPASANEGPSVMPWPAPNREPMSTGPISTARRIWLRIVQSLDLLF